MGSFHTTILVAALAMLASATHASADGPRADRATTAVGASIAVGVYPALTRGRVVLINAQRLVITEEPPPVATLSEPPPEPLVADDAANRPTAPSPSAIWVAGHWAYGAAGFQWVAGRYVAARTGHAFVPPRWAVFQEQHLFFRGFFVPHGIFVRSHFNRFFFSGTPTGTVNRNGTAQRVDRGPYWPVGAPTRSSRASTSARARDPYWPVGAPTRANSPFNRIRTPSQFRPVGLSR